MTGNKKNPAPAGAATLTSREIEDARHEGATEYVKEGSKRAMAADTGTQGDLEASAEAERKRVAPHANTTFLAPLLDLPLDQLSPRLANDKVADPIDFENAKALLALERAGRNRTGYVKALMERIGVDSPYEVTHAGPPYTNDETAVSAL